MAQHQTPAHSGQATTFLKIEPYEHGGIPIVSPAVNEEGWIDPVYAKAGDDMSPPLQWTSVLEAETYVLVVEDPDAPQERPMIHWLMWNIPGKLEALPQGVAKTKHPEGLEGAVQGRNGHGEFGWTGMAPPQGGGVHHYHFQLFALSRSLDFPPDTPLEELVNALRGNTVAKGEMVALFEIADLNSPARTGSYSGPAEAREPHTA